MIYLRQRNIQNVLYKYIQDYLRILLSFSSSFCRVSTSLSNNFLLSISIHIYAARCLTFSLQVLRRARFHLMCPLTRPLVTHLVDCPLRSPTPTPTLSTNPPLNAAHTPPLTMIHCWSEIMANTQSGKLLLDARLLARPTFRPSSVQVQVPPAPPRLFTIAPRHRRRRLLTCRGRHLNELQSLEALCHNC